MRSDVTGAKVSGGAGAVGGGGVPELGKRIMAVGGEQSIREVSL